MALNCVTPTACTAEYNKIKQSPRRCLQHSRGIAIVPLRRRSICLFAAPFQASTRRVPAPGYLANYFESFILRCYCSPLRRREQFRRGEVHAMVLWWWSASRCEEQQRKGRRVKKRTDPHSSASHGSPNHDQEGHSSYRRYPVAVRLSLLVNPQTIAFFLKEEAAKEGTLKLYVLCETTETKRTNKNSNLFFFYSRSMRWRW